MVNYYFKDKLHAVVGLSLVTCIVAANIAAIFN